MILALLLASLLGQPHIEGRVIVSPEEASEYVTVHVTCVDLDTEIAATTYSGDCFSPSDPETPFAMVLRQNRYGKCETLVHSTIYRIPDPQGEAVGNARKSWRVRFKALLPGTYVLRFRAAGPAHLVEPEPIATIQVGGVSWPELP